MLSIDITDKQIKLVRGALSGQKIRVLEVETRELSAGSISNGYLTDVPAVAGEITDIIATKNIKDKEAIVCINSGSILYKELSVPKPKKISNSAAIESMILTTMGITRDYNISYSIVGEEKGEKDEPMIKLLATAVPQRMVDSYIRLFTQLGIKLQQINVSNNCINRLVLNTAKLDASMPLMLAQIDNDFININLYEDGQVTLSRYIRIDPYDYNNSDDYLNDAVYDNIYRTLQFTNQRPGAKPLKELMFYGQVRDFISLSNRVSEFNVPAHILSMPNNIVTFCDFDFAEYANAIGAFFKVRKDYDHVNLLDASAVKEKKGMSGFAILTGVCAVASIAVVGIGYFVINGIVDSKTKQGDAIYDQIHNEENDRKLEELSQKNEVLDGISNYGTNLKQADLLFEYRPKGIPVVKDKILEVLDTFEDTMVEGDVSINGYTVNCTVSTKDIDNPAKIIRALLEQDYFENITYNGFAGTETFSDRNAAANGEEGDRKYTFTLSMRVRGGNGYEEAE